MMTLLNDAGLPYQVQLLLIRTSGNPCYYVNRLSLRLSVIRNEFQIVLTKADCVSARELYLAVHTAVDAMRLKKRNGCFPFVHTISAKTGLGLADFKRDIARTVYREAEEIIETEAPLEGGA